MAKTTSLAKTEANRKNAQLSTGPKTDVGRALVRHNALKHGLLSMEVVIAAGDGKESAEEFEQLLQGLADELRPVGTVEEMLVEKIAVGYWRLRRVVRCEVGEIRKHTDSFHHEREQELAGESTSSFAEDDRPKQDSSAVIEDQLEVVEDARRLTRQQGVCDEDTIAELRKAFKNENPVNHLEYCNLCLTEEGRAELTVEWDLQGELLTPDEARQELLALLTSKKRELRQVLPAVRERERLAAESELARLSLPSEQVADRILRYETAIERGLYRAIHELQRLQSARNGQNVPAPVVLDVDLSSNAE